MDDLPNIIKNTIGWTCQGKVESLQSNYTFLEGSLENCR